MDDKQHANKEKNATHEEKLPRRKFLLGAGRAVAACALAGTAARILMPGKKDAEFDKPGTRYAWRIDPEKCVYCGGCETACIRKPSAVKAVNDQKKCSFCVICYGHVSDQHVDSKHVDKAEKICPNNAVTRKRLAGGLDGYYQYTIDAAKCVGCGKCVAECNDRGTSSMFLLIRPDLCLNCNECEIAKQCPAEAIERVPICSEDEFRGIYGIDGAAFSDMDMGTGT
jgi:electron transport complex protein RnfB